MTLTIRLPDPAVTLTIPGEAPLTGPDDLPQAATASLVCAACHASTSLTGEAVFLTDWDDDLRVHELHFEVTLRGACVGCDAPLRAFLRLVVYRDRQTNRRWVESGLPTVQGGHLADD
jgi:hypothetical protein